jgi:hypothetical protein
MKFYEITNLSHSSVVIEDIGIRLRGYGSQARITESQYMDSRSLKDISHLVKVSQVAGFSFWPFNRKTKPADQVTPSVREEPVSAIPIQIVPVQGNEPVAPAVADSSSAKIEDLVNKMNDLMSVMQEYTKASKDRPMPLNSFYTPNSPEYKSDAEPVFIPANIVPQARIESVTIKEDVQHRPDIDEASMTLKKLRKKK